MRGLYAIVDLSMLEALRVDPLAFASQVLQVRPCALQLRAKEQPARQTLALLRALVPLCRGARVPLVCNDRADLAILAGCDMVHLGQGDAPVDLVRRLSPGLGIGMTTHDLTQLARALDAHPRYVAFGPVFPSKERPAGAPARAPAVGLERLREAVAMARSRHVPLVAIGGLSVDNAADAGLIADAGALMSGLVTDRHRLHAHALSLHAMLGGREGLLATAPA